MKRFKALTIEETQAEIQKEIARRGWVAGVDYDLFCLKHFIASYVGSRWNLEDVFDFYENQPLM